MLKIFTIPSWYKSSKYPENSLFVYEQMQALKKIGHKIVVLSPQPSRNFISNNSIEYIDDNGIDTYYTNVFAIYPSKFRFLYAKLFYNSVKKLFEYSIKQHGRPDVLYAHFSFPAGYVAARLGKEYGIPVVVQEHFSGLMDRKIDKQLCRIVRKTVLKSDEFICVSEGLKEAIIKHTRCRHHISVVSNMINPCFKYTKPVEHVGFRFFALGSLIHRKGFDLLIRAFAQEFVDEEHVYLDIAGSGIEINKLKLLIKEYGIQDKIKLLGQLSREKTNSAYINCDCFVLPSRAETYGLVYREALAVGRPIISTKHGGFTEADWHDDYGYLIDIDSIDQLRRSLRKVFKEYSRFDLKKISSLCLDDCSETVIIQKISQKLESVI